MISQFIRESVRKGHGGTQVYAEQLLNEVEHLESELAATRQRLAEAEARVKALEDLCVQSYSELTSFASDELRNKLRGIVASKLVTRIDHKTVTPLTTNEQALLTRIANKQFKDDDDSDFNGIVGNEYTTLWDKGLIARRYEHTYATDLGIQALAAQPTVASQSEVAE